MIYLVPRGVATSTVITALLLVTRVASGDEQKASSPSMSAPADGAAPPNGEPQPSPPASVAKNALQAVQLPAPKSAPVGHAAPPTAAATHGDGPIRVGIEVFASYTYRSFRNEAGDTTWFHQFDLDRAHAAIDAELEGVRGRLLVESTRSASEGALTGVAGDSFVLRVREAWGAYRPLPALVVSAGVMPTETIPAMEGTWMMRPIAASALELAGLASPADVGVKIKAHLPGDYGFVSTAAYNGEGYTNRELNRGKNTEFATEVHPLANTKLLPLGIFLSYVGGSSGTALARADRVTGGLVWQGARVRAGAFATFAWGVGDVSRQRALVATAFVRVEPIDRWLVGARGDHVVRDVDGIVEDRLTTVFLAAGYRIAEPLEVFLGASRAVPTARAQAELPGSNTWEGRAVARCVF